MLAVLNQDDNNFHNNKEFFSIHPKNILLLPKHFVRNHRRQIPTEFDFQISDSILDDRISIDAKIHMKTIDVQHMRIFIINYWRYHVKTTGRISLDSTTEILDNKSQIIEYLNFKS